MYLTLKYKNAVVSLYAHLCTIYKEKEQGKTVKNKRGWEKFGAQFIWWDGQYLKGSHVVSTRNHRSEERSIYLSIYLSMALQSFCWTLAAFSGF
jgi:hypothetical protein